MNTFVLIGGCFIIGVIITYIVYYRKTLLKKRKLESIDETNDSQEIAPETEPPLVNETNESLEAKTSEKGEAHWGIRIVYFLEVGIIVPLILEIIFNLEDTASQYVEGFSMLASIFIFLVCNPFRRLSSIKATFFIVLFAIVLFFLGALSVYIDNP